MELRWIDADLHEAGVTALLTAGRRRSSLVDGTSFEAMRREGSDVAFAFDPDFRERGFRFAR